MSDRQDGGPAFPVGSGDMRDPCGMTLRDWFAGQALVGILAGNVWKEIIIKDNPEAEAYRMADAMLAERGKK